MTRTTIGLALVTWLTGVSLTAAAEPRIADIRVGRHAAYDRLVIELEADTPIAAWRSGPKGDVMLQIGARPLLQSQQLDTPAPRIGRIWIDAIEGGARIRVERRERRVRAFRLSDPTRIVVDFADPGAEPFSAPGGARLLDRIVAQRKRPAPARDATPKAAAQGSAAKPSASLAVPRPALIEPAVSSAPAKTGRDKIRIANKTPDVEAAPPALVAPQAAPAPATAPAPEAELPSAPPAPAPDGSGDARAPAPDPVAAEPLPVRLEALLVAEAPVQGPAPRPAADPTPAPPSPPQVEEAPTSAAESADPPRDVALGPTSSPAPDSAGVELPPVSPGPRSRGVGAVARPAPDPRWLGAAVALATLALLSWIGLRIYRQQELATATGPGDGSPQDRQARAAYAQQAALLGVDRLDILERRLDDEVRARMLLEERLVQAHEEIDLLHDRLRRGGARVEVR